MKHFTVILALFSFMFTTAQTMQRIGDYIESMTFNDPTISEAPRIFQYTPEGDAFVCVNGNNRFTRALYGSNTLFRLETSDRPVFGIYNKNNNKNISFGISVNGKYTALDSTDYCKAAFIAGKRDYELKDAAWGNGILKISALALPDKDGAIWKISAKEFPQGTKFECCVDDIRARRLNRNGDMGADPPDSFERAINSGNEQKSSFELDNKTHFLVFEELTLSEKDFVAGAAIYNNAEDARHQLATQVKIETPDPFINTLGGVLTTAGDGIWDGIVWQHGAIGWRTPLPGWRAAYTGDVLGWHDRARTHFDNYANSQITDIKATIPHPTQDTALSLARAVRQWGTPMYSDGYICRSPNSKNQMNHYNMNLVYIDELLWHFNWTGDLDYMRKMFPVLKKSLLWEKLNYDPNDDGLYDAYACTWASDALQYNSGAVTYSSAYNYRAHKMAAEIAKKLGEADSTYFENEANKILSAINKTLWLPNKGIWAEFQDFMGNKLMHPDAGIWTVYHALDSEIHNPFQAYQATRYVDTKIPQIPIKANGLNGNYYTISTTNWLPYSWSVNNVAFAEVVHTSLAYWQAGRHNEAFNLFKSAVLDGMYLGRSPGNIGQISHYDAARGESYRDFGDPVGVYSRAVVQGLFGILPDAINNKITVQPGFPNDWDFASISTPDIACDFKRTGNKDVYKIENKFRKDLQTELRITARNENIKNITLNGKNIRYMVSENVGAPEITIYCGEEKNIEIVVEWAGKTLDIPTFAKQTVTGEMWKLQSTSNIIEIYDPQNVLKNTKTDANSITGNIAKQAGNSTLFVKLRQGEMEWWQPVDVEILNPFTVNFNPESSDFTFSIKNNLERNFSGKILLNAQSRKFARTISLEKNAVSENISVQSKDVFFGTNILQIEENGKIIFETKLINWNLKNEKPKYQTVNMDATFNDKVSQIFRNSYLSPRSPYTTMQIPTQGIGEWCHPLLTADIDDSGIRQATQNGIFSTPMGIPFRTTSDNSAKNIAFTTLFDNYSSKTEIPVSGKFSHAYFLMAGSTNHMQCHIVNGTVSATYTDGTVDVLELINPETWAPIEQDFYVDGKAFRLKAPRPYRVALKTGIVSRNMERDMRIKPTEVYGRTIDGGAGIILDLPLNPKKQLSKITVETIANEVVIGMMGVTLMK